MTLCLFSTFFFVLFLNLSMGSLRLTQLNRTFMNSYKGMYEACVVTVGDDGEPIKPYFEQNLLKSYVADYLEPNISKYVTDYDLDLQFFYNKEDIGPAILVRRPRTIKLSLKAKINYLYSYSKSKSFSIKERTEL